MSNIHFKEILFKSGLAFIFKIAGIILNYVLIFYISKKIGVEAVGIYNISFVTMLFLAMVFTLGLNFSITRFTGEYINDKTKLRKLYNKCLQLVVPASFLGAFFLYLFSDYIALNFYKDVQYARALKIISIISPMYILTVFNIEYIRGVKKIIVSEFIRNIINPLLIIIALFVLSFYDLNELSTLYGIAVSVFIGFGFSMFSTIRYNNGFVNSEKGNISSKELLSPSIPLLIMGLAAFFLSESGLFILEIYFDSKEVGDYTIIYKISLAGSLIFLTISTIIGPKFAELFWANKTNELKKSILYSSKIIFILSVPVIILLIIFSKFLLQIFGLDIELKTSLQILITGQFIYAITGVAGVYLMVTNKQKVFRNIYIISAILNLMICFLLIPKYGVLGASIAISVSYIVLNIICTIYMHKKEKIIALYLPKITNNEE